MNANSLWEGDGGEIRRLLLAQEMYHPDDYFLALNEQYRERGLSFSPILKKLPLHLSYILIYLS